MSERIQLLAQEVLGKPSLAACSLPELKNLVQRYPYFAPAQFLLLQKLKQENSPDYGTQLQRSVLYYPDPIQFEYFIASEKFDTEINFDEQENVAMQNENETFSNQTVTNETDSGALPNDELHATVNEENSLPDQNIISDVIPDAPHQQLSIEHIEHTTDKEPEHMQGQHATVLQQETTNQQQQATEELTFEPFHTVDYFASQGIKLGEEIAKDKLGRQLKSFTEWLKTMKRLPAKDIAARTDLVSEKKIEHLAEDSVHDPGVVTEAMAEVWVKQGNVVKAIEVYDKLSLLNPSKLAYFADKIQNLKRF